MRVKFTILICALLVLGLAVSQADAQGYRVASKKNNVVQSGNNQMLGAIRLTHRTVSEGNVHIPENNTIEITFGGLTITNAADISDTASVAKYLAVSGGPTVTIKAANDEDTNAGKITIDVDGTADGTITVMGVRADVTGMDDGDAIVATISSTGSSDDFLESTDSGDSAAIKVSTVKDGLNVTEVTAISQLTCDRSVSEDRTPSIKIEEGFNAAWETGAGGGLDATGDDSPSNDTHIRIVVANVPSGVTFRWPGQGNFDEDDVALPDTHEDFFANPMDLRDRDDDDSNEDTAVATLMYSSAGTKIGDDTTKHWVVYRFMGTDDDDVPETDEHNELKNVFTIAPMVVVDTKKTGTGGVSDAWAQLWPEKGDDDLDDKLSYSHGVETKDKGYFVTVTECVTYLLYPFLTCGAQADWTTGIAVANTTLDDDVFPVNEGAAAQGGSVMIHAYPKSTAEEKAAVGHNSSPEMLADPITTTISGNLAAGDSVAMTCNMHPMLAGFEGYAIVRAGFRAAHGMAFVLGNFMDGAAIDVAHGYIALVIPDPEYAGSRGVTSGESLGH